MQSCLWVGIQKYGFAYENSYQILLQHKTKLIQASAVARPFVKVEQVWKEKGQCALLCLLDCLFVTLVRQIRRHIMAKLKLLLVDGSISYSIFDFRFKSF